MKRFIKYIEKLTADLRLLKDDIPKAIMSMENKQQDAQQEVSSDQSEVAAKASFKGVAPKSFQPMSQLRRSKEEAIEANKRPEPFFVTDKIKEIFSK